MATEFALQRTDKQPIGSFDDVQAIIREVFPNVAFHWTQSGADKLKLAEERGIEFPAALRESLKTLPSLLQGRYQDDHLFVDFGLGFEEPVKCLYVTPHGESPGLAGQLSALELAVGGTLVIGGEEPIG